MKEKFDFSLMRALLKKQRQERTYPYRKGNFNIMGFILRVVLIAAIVALFAVFFGKFADIYTSVKTDGALNVNLRTLELLSMIYTAVILFMTIGAVGQIGREIFGADDIKIFSAMPVDAKSLFAAKLITIYLGQLVVSALVVLTVNITFAFSVEQSVSYWLVTILVCLVLPLITIAIASLLVMPVYVVKQFLSERFIINFILVTVVLGCAFYLYSVILGGVKQMLLGEDLRYFFNERVMNGIASFTAFLYPARWIANILTGNNLLISYIALIVLIAVCLVASLLIIRLILTRALQSRISGTTNYLMKKGKITNGDSSFFALIKKEFLVIFRTPSYMFSYLSVAVIMPLMVYFCMSVGMSLVDNLIGIQCGFELALFLTILFGALTNVFCATNVSRDGEMFYIVKAFPINYKTVFFSKITLCLIVTALSQLASAILLLATGMVNWYTAITLFVVGMLFSFVNIAVATRYDFNHAHFSTEEDGEIKGSGNTVSTIIVLGMLISFLVGGIVFVLRVLVQLKQLDLDFLTYLVAIAGAIISAALAYFYFIMNLNKKYYEFEGGI